MNNQQVKEIQLQRNAVLADVFGADRARDFSEEDKDEIYFNIITELIYRYASSEYFEDAEDFLNDIMRDLYGENPYAEDREDADEEE